jgi:hypothetical protein
VSVELINAVEPNKWGAWSAAELNIRTDTEAHTGILCEDRTGLFIVDYTMRQFDSELPFPFVGKISDWMATIGVATGSRWEFVDEDEKAY